VPPRKRATDGQGELFGATSTKDIQGLLWKAADKLRGSIDAALYKEYVLGLIFLKYVSDAFDERRATVRAELEAEGDSEEMIAEELEEDDTYKSANVFIVPDGARWDSIARRLQSEGAGLVLDDAMQAIMDKNERLRGVLPKIYNDGTVDSRVLAGLVDLLGDARFSSSEGRSAKDVLGEVYEYFLGEFARAEGKKAGEFYTPASIVRLLVEVLEPYKGRVYDPCCGSGGMFVQASKFIEAHAGKTHRVDIAVYGQESNRRTWRLAQMNLAIHAINGKLGDGPADTFSHDRHPDLRADFVMANPPFNLSDWNRNTDDQRWKYGTPPASNANYAWLQHIVYKLGQKGTAGVVLANGSMSSKSNNEGTVRAQLIEHDLVACMVALPSQLFRNTQIPACLWFLVKDKTDQGGTLNDCAGQILFIDARNLGAMVDRTERVLTEEDLATIAGTYHAWRGTSSATGAKYEDVPGFCKSEELDVVRGHDYILTPGRYVGAAETQDEDYEPVGEKISRLTRELFDLFDESDRRQAEVRTQLGRIDA
jgi:type I restriction enzyme M protein